ncbi:hypothetical protein ILUMI_01571 [Ignelater luminosus]|uniref:Ketimine reductase mu-crystallin n=1 Tax=Ignelater luminosus TaxID=2038154 RepID=A0A8K0DF34_IGNLU|nr:hypothetical protein ILUMI_01571 [Ignelater luminosus]
MPGYLSDGRYGGLGCKLVTYFPGNPDRSRPLPSIMANIILMDDETGELKAIVDGTEITSWRTAAASAVATKYLHHGKPNSENKILSIIGAGTQGKIHAIAFQHFFKFSEVRVWNRNSERATNLVKELNGKASGTFVAHDNVQECVREADVIVTATAAEEPVIKNEWLKKGVHINGLLVKYFCPYTL